MQSNHEQFIIYTKPRLNMDDVLLAIHTVILKRKKQGIEIYKKDIIGLVGYLDEVRNYRKEGVTRVSMKYDDITYFTIKPFVNEDNEEEALFLNYVWFLTKSREYYFFKSSLKKLKKVLPTNFIRINKSYIINFSTYFLGRTN